MYSKYCIFCKMVFSDIHEIWENKLFWIRGISDFLMNFMIKKDKERSTSKLRNLWITHLGVFWWNFGIPIYCILVKTNSFSCNMYPFLLFQLVYWKTHSRCILPVTTSEDCLWVQCVHDFDIGLLVINLILSVITFIKTYFFVKSMTFNKS